MIERYPAEILRTARATYWLLSDGTYIATPPSSILPPPVARGGGLSLLGVMRERGDSWGDLSAEESQQIGEIVHAHNTRRRATETRRPAADYAQFLLDGFDGSKEKAIGVFKACIASPNHFKGVTFEDEWVQAVLAHLEGETN